VPAQDRTWLLVLFAPLVDLPTWVAGRVRLPPRCAASRRDSRRRGVRLHHRRSPGGTAGRVLVSKGDEASVRASVLHAPAARQLRRPSHFHTPGQMRASNHSAARILNGGRGVRGGVVGSSPVGDFDNCIVAAVNNTARKGRPDTRLDAAGRFVAGAAQNSQDAWSPRAKATSVHG
jgi:hypothetical protein